MSDSGVIIEEYEEPEQDQETKYNITQGKVRDIWDCGYNKLVLIHSNRLSSFDRYICDISNKGQVLNLTSKWWFEKTRHIVQNHLLFADSNYMIVEKCKVIPIEVVLRAYITGSTQTSLWTHYSNGSREYCGIKFPDGLKKNQRLDQVVITPTTKGIVDVPISGAEVVAQGFCTKVEWDFICQKALELFDYASQVADEKGYILVDTKMEFGRTCTGHIILIDEVFTCDSSRWWLKKTYQERFEKGENPESLDKDIIRNYIKEKCDPYNQPLPEIPEKLKRTVESAYVKFFEELTGSVLPLSFETDPNNFLDHQPIKKIAEQIRHFLINFQNPYVLIFSESIDDQFHVTEIQMELKKHQIFSHWIYYSPYIHTPQLLALLDDIMESVEFNNRKMVIVSTSQLLGGIISGNTNIPVIFCPDEDKYKIQEMNVALTSVLGSRMCAKHIYRLFKMCNWI